jgi:hypothetical protein
MHPYSIILGGTAEESWASLVLGIELHRRLAMMYCKSHTCMAMRLLS